MVTFALKNNQTISIRLLTGEDRDQLLGYLTHLSEESKERFAPHSFDKSTIETICAHIEYKDTLRYTAITDTKHIVAYMLIKMDVLPCDAERLNSYGVATDGQTDCTFAPSVADHLHGSGLATKMFEYILSDLIYTNTKRIILWGGVQSNNLRAIHYYEKLGFVKVGVFERKGLNYDMIKDIR